MTDAAPRSPRFPVSIKGVVFLDGRVVLLKNERDEWELPGGKLEPGEDPPACPRREIAEELALEVETHAILDSWLYRIQDKGEVLIVTYGCDAKPGQTPVLSHEHKEVGLFRIDELDAFNIPAGYARSIRGWASRR